METLANLTDVSLKRGRSTVVSGVNFRVEPGQQWVILGPNGAGKTTVARLLSARDYPTKGSAVVLGSETSGEDANYLASRVGVAASDLRERIDPAERVLDVVSSAAWGQTTRFSEEYEEADTRRALDLLAALGVEKLADRPFGSLSEGEKQRVAIARALMADPEILLLDEPTAGLDLGARETLLRALTELMSGRHAPAIVLITHEIEEIPAGFTHALLMKGGTVQAAGPIAEVLTSERLSEAFDIPLAVTQEGGRWWARAV